MYDAIIVGGSAAGLSAALILGRFRRSVLVCDSGSPRNAPADAVHGFFTRDGTPPAELYAIAHAELRPYETVKIVPTTVTDITQTDTGFRATAEDGTEYDGRTILLATGIRDELLPIPGIADYWARGVYHCPYCHGYEVRDQPIAVIGSGPVLHHLPPLLRLLSNDVVVCTNGETCSPEDRDALKSRGITLYEQPIAAIHGDHNGVTAIEFADGLVLPRTAIFAGTSPHVRGSLIESLGCALTEQGLVQVDELGHTSVKGVYAAGDISSRMQQVIQAAASGARAGAGINTDLL